MEELPIAQGLCETQNVHPSGSAPSSDPAPDPMQLIGDCGLADIDVEGCEVSDEWKRKLAELMLTYKDIFSRDKLDCGEAKGFVHRIHLTAPSSCPFEYPQHTI